MTAIFYTAIHVLGMICLLPFSRKIPAWFIASTGFGWGLLIWGACSLISALLGLPFTIWAVLLLILPALACALALAITKKTYRLGKQGWALLGVSVLVIAGLALLLTRSSVVYATTDSFNYIYHGKILARSGMVPWAINNFTKLGAFSSVIQMSSAILPGQYLSGYQTILGLSLLVVLFVSMTLELKRAFSPAVAMVLSGALVLAMLSTTFLEQIFYIHNNLPAAAFLFLALYCFWHYYRDDDLEWLLLGLAAVTGFSFTRIEGPLYAVAVLALVITVKPQSYRRTLILILPYAAIAGAWHGFLFSSVAQNEQLSQSYLLLIISALVGLALLALASQWLQPLLRHIPQSVVLILGAALILAVIFEPDHMIQSITHFWQNLLNSYFWGWTWIIAAGIIPIQLIHGQKSPESRLVLTTIAAYILIVLLLALARIPYRLGKTDSANRLMVQLLPLCYFAIASGSAKLKELFPGSGRSN